MVALSKAKQRMKSTTDDALDRVGPVAGSATRTRSFPPSTTRSSEVAPALSDAGGKLGSALDDAKDKVAPALEETRDRIGPLLEDARSLVVPVAQQAIAESKRRGRSAAVTLRLAEEPKQSHKLRNLLVLLRRERRGLVRLQEVLRSG